MRNRILYEMQNLIRSHWRWMRVGVMCCQSSVQLRTLAAELRTYWSPSRTGNRQVIEVEGDEDMDESFSNSRICKNTGAVLLMFKREACEEEMEMERKMNTLVILTSRFKYKYSE